MNNESFNNADPLHSASYGYCEDGNADPIDSAPQGRCENGSNAPIDQGFRAYKMGIPEDQCPYAVEDENFWKWNEGWNLARRAELEEEHNHPQYYQFPY